MTPEEAYAYWYSKQDLSDIAERTSAVVEMMRSNGGQKSNKYCIRGLERFKSEQSEEIFISKKKEHKAAVFHVQRHFDTKLQSTSPQDYAEKLAQTSRRFSRFHVLSALYKGARDAEVARRIRESASRSMSRRASCGSTTSSYCSHSYLEYDDLSCHSEGLKRAT